MNKSRDGFGIVFGTFLNAARGLLHVLGVVVRLVQDTFLRQPSPRNIAYKLNNPALVDPSDGQSKGILRLLGNHVRENFKQYCHP